MRERRCGDRLPKSLVPKGSRGGAQILALVHRQGHLAWIFQPLRPFGGARIWRVAHLAGRLVQRCVRASPHVRHQSQREHLAYRSHRTSDQLEYAGDSYGHAHAGRSAGHHRQAQCHRAKAKERCARGDAQCLLRLRCGEERSPWHACCSIGRVQAGDANSPHRQLHHRAGREGCSDRSIRCRQDHDYAPAHALHGSDLRRNSDRWSRPA